MQTIDTQKQYYSDRIKHFILFQDKRYPVTMGRVEAEVFWIDQGQAKKTGWKVRPVFLFRRFLF